MRFLAALLITLGIGGFIFGLFAVTSFIVKYENFRFLGLSLENIALILTGIGVFIYFYIILGGIK